MNEKDLAGAIVKIFAMAADCGIVGKDTVYGDATLHVSTSNDEGYCGLCVEYVEQGKTNIAFLDCGGEVTQIKGASKAIIEFADYLCAW